MKISLKIKGLLSSKPAAIFLLLVCSMEISFACEICGCSGNGYHYGILPQFRKNILGIRYTNRRFFSQHLISEQLLIPGNTSTEYFSSTELWGRFYLGKKIQLLAFLPFNNFRQVENGVSSTASGPGDMTVAFTYTLFDNASDIGRDFKQTLLAGAGVKLPVGKFNPSSGGGELNPSMNTGTGSVDYLVNTIYTCRYKRTGINADFNYRLNGANKNEFRYGDRITTAAKFFYWKDVGKKTTLLPNAGIMYEKLQEDTHYSDKQHFSGGNITFFTAGLELYTGRINVGCTYNDPLSQQLSRGYVKAKSQFSVTFNYMF